MKKFHAGKLHSGKGGAIVTNPHQARAIQLSYLRKEGHRIPYKRGGKTVPLSSLRRAHKS
jgi:hypothetical protein